MTFKVSPGTKDGFVEIRFSERPDETTIAGIKSAGFRFSASGGDLRWYGKEERLPAKYKTPSAAPPPISGGAIKPMSHTTAMPDGREIKFVPAVKNEEPAPRSWKVGVKTAGDRDWVSNAIRYATKEDAETGRLELIARWFAVQESCVLPTQDDVYLPRTSALSAMQKFNAAMATVEPFLGTGQKKLLPSLLKSEEKQFFIDKIIELADIIEKMPKTGETEKMGDDAVAHLHYFAGGRGNWYITEKDAGSPNDAPEEKGKQQQAFGLADLFGDGGEMGYISIEEIIQRGELDFHWKPKTLAEVRGKKDEDDPEPPKAVPVPQLPPMAGMSPLGFKPPLAEIKPAVALSNFEKFKNAYRDSLHWACKMYPDEYAFKEDAADAIAESMCKAVKRGSYNHDGHAFKKTCKELGIKHTRKAIQEFIGEFEEPSQVGVKDEKPKALLPELKPIESLRIPNAKSVFKGDAMLPGDNQFITDGMMLFRKSAMDAECLSKLSTIKHKFPGRQPNDESARKLLESFTKESLAGDFLGYIEFSGSKSAQRIACVNTERGPKLFNADTVRFLMCHLKSDGFKIGLSTGKATVIVFTKNFENVAILMQIEHELALNAFTEILAKRKVVLARTEKTAVPPPLKLVEPKAEPVVSNVIPIVSELGLAERFARIRRMASTLSTAN